MLSNADGVLVAVGVFVGVRVFVTVGVSVGVRVSVGVNVGVDVGQPSGGQGVGVGVSVGVLEGVLVGGFGFWCPVNVPVFPPVDHVPVDVWPSFETVPATSTVKLPVVPLAVNAPVA